MIKNTALDSLLRYAHKMGMVVVYKSGRPCLVKDPRKKEVAA